MGALRGIVAVVAGLALGAAPAAAQSTADVAVPGELIAGPVLADGAAVGVDSPGRGQRAIRAYRAGEPPQPLPAFDALLRDRGDFYLAGSPTRVAVARDGRRGATAALLSGPLDGPATLLGRCEGDQSWWPLLASGDRLIFNGPSDVDCRTRATLQGRDLSQDPPAAFDVPPKVPLSDFSWPYAAWVDPEARRQVVVYDLSKHAEAYRIRIAGLAKDGGPPRLTVDSDGTLVAAYESNPPPSRANNCYDLSNAFWASPAAPSPHPLADPPCYSGFLALRGGRLADSPTGYYGTDVVRVRTLPDGAPRPVSAPIGDDTPGEPDFDGRRLAYTQRDCRGGDRVIVEDVDEALARGPYDAGSCPLQIAIRARPMDRRGRIRVRMTCPNGCWGDFLIRGDGHSFDLLGDGFFNLPAGGPRTRVLHLYGQEVALVRRLGQVRVRITADVRQPSGASAPVTRRVTLRYPR